MSVRMLRRALKEQEAQDSHRVEGVIADEDDDTPNEKPAQNLFNLLGSEEIEEDVDEAEDEGEVAISSESQMSKNSSLTANLSKSKKKRSKGKKERKILEFTRSRTQPWL